RRTRIRKNSETRPDVPLNIRGLIRLICENRKTNLFADYCVAACSRRARWRARACIMGTFGFDGLAILMSIRKAKPLRSDHQSCSRDSAFVAQKGSLKRPFPFAA